MPRTFGLEFGVPRSEKFADHCLKVTRRCMSIGKRIQRTLDSGVAAVNESKIAWSKTMAELSMSVLAVKPVVLKVGHLERNSSRNLLQFALDAPRCIGN